VGDKRVGLAISDPTQTLASPFKSISRQRSKHFIERLVEQENIALILVGMPYLPSGGIGIQARKTTKFILELNDMTTVPIQEIDERMSSIEALSLLTQSPGYKRRKKKDKGTLDSAAATVVLQRYLDTKKLKT
jgi:putative Holliday junction resolvase